MKEEVAKTREHYDYTYTRPLTAEEKEAGFIAVKLDPYRICDLYKVGGGAREQILKKALRYTTKGDTEVKVLNEIICAAERRLQMIEEDKC